MAIARKGNIVTGSAYDCPNVFEIPRYCRRLADLLAKQPLFDGVGAVAKKSKVISLDNWDDARIYAIFSANAKNILGVEQAWLITEFGCGNNQLSDSLGKTISQGLTLKLYDTNRPCSLNELEAAYDQVLTKLRTGWVSAQIEENPDILFKQDPDEFHLFIKENSLVDEPTLIRFLTSKFSLEGHMECYGDWAPPSKYNGKIYLWIRKSEFDSVIEKFGFHSPPLHSVDG